jgi:hypothetical protein
MYVLRGSRSSGGKRAGPTIYELNAGGEGRSRREIPRLVAAGLAITWRAGRRELITMAVLELLSGIGVAAEVVVGRRVLEAILATQHAGAGSAGVRVSAGIGSIVRAFGLADFLRARHDRLYDERITEMRRISVRQLRGEESLSFGERLKALPITALWELTV